MAKKIFSIFFLRCFRAALLALLCGAVFAGSGVAQPLAKGALVGKAFTARGLTSPQISRILTERVYRTRGELDRWIRAYREVLLDEELPANRIVGWPSKKRKFMLYSEIPFWEKLSAADQRNYFLSANNRAIQRVIKERGAALDKLKQLLPRLWQEKITFAGESPEELLASVIPPETKYILLGEEHDRPAVQHFVARFLRKYREAYPGRKVILLTEFLPVGNQKNTFALQDINQDSPDYARVFRVAIANNISVYGLEAKCIYYGGGNADVSLSEQSPQKFDLWSLPEAMRLRNRFWLEQIEASRQKNPNAVLIIYAGSEHLSYYAPFSVGARLPADETFSAHVFDKRNAPIRTLDFLDWLGDEKYPFYKEKVLFWKDKTLRRAVGFDIRFAVSSADAPARQPYKNQ